MSGIVCITPLIAVSGVAGWSVYAAAIAATAAGMGLRILAEKMEEVDQEAETERNTVELPLENAKVVEQTLQRASRVRVQGDGFEITFIKDPRGDCKVEVTGETLSCEELRARGQEMIQKVNQEYARIRIKEELKKKGYVLEKEEQQEDGTIRLTVGKWQ